MLKSVSYRCTCSIEKQIKIKLLLSASTEGVTGSGLLTVSDESAICLKNTRSTISHPEPPSHYANCSPADLVARVTKDVALPDFNAEHSLNSVELPEGVVRQRSEDISAWILAEIYQDLVRMYQTAPVSAEHHDWLHLHIETLMNTWPESLQQFRWDNL